MEPRTTHETAPPPAPAWGVAIALGAGALVRPLLSVIGVFDALGRPAGPLLVTGVIAVVWVVVGARTRQPVATLALAGVVYAVGAFALNLLLQSFLEDTRAVPLIGLVAMLVTNAVYGAVLGLVAWGVQVLKDR